VFISISIVQKHRRNGSAEVEIATSYEYSQWSMDKH